MCVRCVSVKTVLRRPSWPFMNTAQKAQLACVNTTQVQLRPNWVQFDPHYSSLYILVVVNMAGIYYYSTEKISAYLLALSADMIKTHQRSCQLLKEVPLQLLQLHEFQSKNIQLCILYVLYAAYISLPVYCTALFYTFFNWTLAEIHLHRVECMHKIFSKSNRLSSYIGIK